MYKKHSGPTNMTGIVDVDDKLSIPSSKAVREACMTLRTFLLSCSDAHASLEELTNIENFVMNVQVDRQRQLTIPEMFK
jgi:hypothetical protein